MSPKYRYIEWLSAEEMHESSILWFSTLKFIRDEQLFLNNLVKSYTLQLVDSKIFEESKRTIAALQSLERDLVSLFKKVQAHENQLEIMTDDIDQLKMERAYIETHKELQLSMHEYEKRYREIKEKLFGLISGILKKSKQKRLLN
ncbi:MAG: hypothetical protein AB3N14_17875 [Flavobacteriaceae bacterium]